MPHILNVDDEVGIGVDLDGAPSVQNKCIIFKVQKMVVPDVITLDDSDDEELVTSKEKSTDNDSKFIM